MEGSIPVCYGGIPTFILDHNHLHGSIPSMLLSTTSIKYAIFEYNLLSGSFPSQISSSLLQLRVGSNDLTGSLPPLLIPNRFISFMSMWNNRLSGSIPSGWVGLSIIDMGLNRLDGSLPNGLWSRGSMAVLNVLSVYSNTLTSSTLGMYVYSLNITVNLYIQGIFAI